MIGEKFANVDSLIAEVDSMCMPPKPLGMMGGMGGNMGGQNPFADLMRQMQDMQNQQGGGSQGQYRDSSIIDGEAREVTPDHKKIEHKNKD